MPTALRPKGKPLTILSSDPLVGSLSHLLKALEHFHAKGFTLCHLQVVLALRLALQIVKNGGVTMGHIESFMGAHCSAFKQEMTDLIERRYIAEIDETFGPNTYRIGATGGTVLRQLFKNLDPTLAFAPKDVA